MDIFTGLCLVAAIVLAVLYYANGKKAEMAMEVARELRKRLDEAGKNPVQGTQESEERYTEALEDSNSVLQSDLELLRQEAEEKDKTIQSLQEQIEHLKAEADKEDTDNILASVKKEADSIIKEANDKAETILEQANSSAEVIRVNARMHYTSERERMEQTVQWQEEKLKKIEQQSEALIAQAYGTRKVIMEGVDVDEFLLANGMYNNLRANILSDDSLTDLGGEVSNLRKKLKANIAAQKKFKKENGGSAAYMKGSRETNFFYTGATTFGTMTFDVMSENIISAVPTEGLEKSLEKVNNLKNICEYHMHSNGNKGLFYTDYIRLKLEELKLVSDIHVLREAKKEEQRRERQRLADEMKAQKDFEREIKRAQKDEEEARKALERAELEAAKEKANKERFVKLQEQIEKLKSALKEAEERGQRILSMAQQTRRGWVYIISNIGSFGEGVYKIGLTRRLDPMERVYELGDASVPFPFDVHAFIFSEDAPALETALHQAFDKYKVNSVNWRKEYFKVSLDAIKRKVAELGYEVDWEDYAYAPQFRDSVLKK